MADSKKRSSGSIRTSRKILIVILALAASTIAMSACETTEGFGKDVKKLGGNIEDGAESNK